jgi:hypothetical protein
LIATASNGGKMETRLVALWGFWLALFLGGYYFFGIQQKIDVVISSNDGMLQLAAWLLASITALTKALYFTYKKVAPKK